MHITTFLKKLFYNNLVRKLKENYFMAKYVCSICGYTHDEELGDEVNGIAPGTKWEDIPESYVCPVCGVGKHLFEKE